MMHVGLPGSELEATPGHCSSATVAYAAPSPVATVEKRNPAAEGSSKSCVGRFQKSGGNCPLRIGVVLFVQN